MNMIRVLLTVVTCVAVIRASALTVREEEGTRWICGEDGRRIVGVGSFLMKQKGWSYETVCSERVDRVDFTFRASGGQGRPSGWMLNLPLGPDAVKGWKVEKLGRWRRFEADPQAQPQEHPLGKYKVIRSPQGNVMFRLPGNENWTNDRRDHVGFTQETDEVWRGSLTLFQMRTAEEPYECAARIHGLPFALKIVTDRRNNLFETNAVQVCMDMTETAGRSVTNVPHALVVRDWDGREVYARRDMMTFRVHERRRTTASIDLPGRGLYFLEASLGGEFVRTTLAVIPPFEFHHRQSSVLGLNLRCDECFKDELEQEYALAARLGMAYLRNGDNRLARRFGMEAGLSAQMPKSDYVAGDEACERQVGEWLDEIAEKEAEIFEFGNEIGHYADTQTRHRLYDRYSVWLDAIRSARAKRGLGFKILYGTSARRPELVRLIDEKKIFDRLDALVVHPGRLNWTSDLAGLGWRYLGLVRNSRLLYEQIGQKDKPIYLTETYTKTRPNDSHSDSLRQSAENAVLNVVLAMAEGCRRLCVYQLHEGVSQDRNGIDISNTEYHYGILNRDNSLKPSAVGYETAAEELDGATFVRWIGRNGTNLNGCLFMTPTGPLAVLWDRTEGYDLRTQGPRARLKDERFFHFEPWLDNWRTKVRHVFKATGDKVTVRDVVGRIKALPATESVRIELTGAPVFVRGLDADGLTNEVGVANDPPADDQYGKNAKIY